MMKLARIGSRSTYYRALKELHNHNFIRYDPSFDSNTGSEVHLYTFDTGTYPKTEPAPDPKMDPLNKDTKNTISKRETNFYDNQKTSKKDSPKTEKSMKEFNNNIDPQQDLFDFEEFPLPEELEPLKSKGKKKLSPSRGDARRAEGKENAYSIRAPEGEMPQAKGRKNTHSTLSHCRGDARRAEGFTPPSLEHVQIYFAEKKQPVSEAERFHNFYECTGWLVGGTKKMKNWKAAARNWMLNIKKYQDQAKAAAQNQNTVAERNALSLSKGSQSNNLKPPGHKPSDYYDEPL
ncbi:MAG: hypothetical protein JEZ14_11265 [Marinilabiliaceae bacterium]|nr:hypothetical protein [Marinilabiliaceae bacterium]